MPSTSAAQRISRGFHRLGLFLAAIPLLLGTAGAVWLALAEADAQRFAYQRRMELVCAQPKVRLFIDTPYKMPLPLGVKVVPPPAGAPITDTLIDVKKLGCSAEAREVSFGAVLNASAEPFSYVTSLLSPLAFFVGLSALVSFIVYAVVRAVGWVIGGFTT